MCKEDFFYGFIYYRYIFLKKIKKKKGEWLNFYVWILNLIIEYVF